MIMFITYLCSFSMASLVTLPTSRNRAAVILPPYNCMACGLAIDKRKISEIIKTSIFAYDYSKTAVKNTGCG